MRSTSTNTLVSHRSQRRRTRVGALALTLGLGGILAVPAVAGAGTAPQAKPVTPDLTFFNGKTITYIVPQSPGGSYAAALIPVIPIVQNLLHATINVVYVPQANSITGQDQIAAATPDGLTIGTMSVSADLANDLEGNPLVNFNLLDESLIVGNLIAPEVIVACDNSPFKSLDSAVKFKSQFQVINTGSGPGFELIKAFFNSYNAPVKSLSGYATSALQTAGCLRGDAPLALQTLAGLTPADFQQGLVKALLITSTQPKSSEFYPYLKGVPTLESYLAKHRPPSAGGRSVMKLITSQYGTKGLGVIVAGPTGIPAARLAALQQVFHKAYVQSTVSAAMTAAGLVPGYVSPAAAKPYMTQLLLHEPLISRFVNYNPV